MRPKDSGWLFSTIYRFQGLSGDGWNPITNVIFGPDGSLYGTTADGGTGNAGTVFNLKPPARACATALCPWIETVIYNFPSFSVGYPTGIRFGLAGNIYGTTLSTVYELTPSGGSWTETTLNTFSSNADAFAGVILDQAGNLYGTVEDPYGGFVYELTGGEFKVLHRFEGNDGLLPAYGLVFDNSGNLYGQTRTGGSGGGGTVYELTPSNGAWTFNVLYSLTGGVDCFSFTGDASLAMDAAGNLYGTTSCGGAYGSGSVFKLKPSDGGWKYSSLHDFCASGWPCKEGAIPWSTVVFDSKGNLYGTTYSGGSSPCGGNWDCGVVWEITP